MINELTTPGLISLINHSTNPRPMPWEEAVELTARGLAALIRRAMSNCITVRPITVIQAAGAEPRIWLTHHAGYILRLLEANGYVSHTFTKRVGRQYYTYYVICRSRNPNTDGRFNEDEARWLWEAARVYPLEEAVRLIAGLITKLDAMAQS